MTSVVVVPGVKAMTSPSLIRSEEHTSELQSRLHLVCRLLLEKKKSHLDDPTNHELRHLHCQLPHDGRAYTTAGLTIRTAARIDCLVDYIDRDYHVQFSS